MPISPPRLDDRNFEDLVEELLARIPAHTPEWVPQPGDPGRTLIELFAWLGETILYRANLIPERQRLAFLKLLGEPMRPGRAATGLVTVALNENDVREVVHVAAGATVSGAVSFETGSELALLPVSAECYYKRSLSEHENDQPETQDVLDGLRAFHEIDGKLSAYVTTRAFSQGLVDNRGVDVIQDTTDHSLWVALFAQAPALVEDVKKALSGVDQGRASIINIGLAPAIEMPSSFDQVSRPGRIAHDWEISTSESINDQPVYSKLTRISDTSDDLTRRGVERFILPGDPNDYGVLEGDVRVDANAGVGDRPPRLDDPDKLSRIVAWLRLRPSRPMTSMRLSWAGINAVEIEQYQTLRGRVIGQSSGLPDQSFSLQVRSVEIDSFELQVEETGRGYRRWKRVDDLALSARDDAVYRLDSEAGTVSFGNGVNGRIPDVGRRIRVERMRAGGGVAGNLPPASLSKISARDLDGQPLNRKFSITQGVATQGGLDAEKLIEAERRIPSRLQHRNRCVTEQDYRSLVQETPGIQLGRVEVLPRFLPQQRRKNVPGVVSVMVLPDKSITEAPNPRPDQPFIERVYSYLDARRPLASELYVIGCEYIPIGLSIGITVRDGEAYDQVVNDVRAALRHHLWSLPPFGPNSEGWPLGRAVQDRELEVVAARVRGVSGVIGVNLFERENKNWKKVKRNQACEAIQIGLLEWQLPELLSVVVSTDGSVSEELRSLPGGTAGAGSGDGADDAFGTAVPIVPEVC
jgi:predicted phage baseplate assembly protein